VVALHAPELADAFQQIQVLKGTAVGTLRDESQNPEILHASSHCCHTT
jgi:hypothetical protein